jgi:hypothetical protein
VDTIAKNNTHGVGIYACACYAAIGKCSRGANKVAWNAGSLNLTTVGDFMQYMDKTGLKGCVA